MQLAPTPGRSSIMNPGLITRLGDVKVGYAMNGIAYTTYALATAPAASVKLHTRSFDQAVAAVRELMMSTVPQSPAIHGYALLLGENLELVASPVLGEPALFHALDTPAGTGGIASLALLNASRSLLGVVTRHNIISRNHQPC